MSDPRAGPTYDFAAFLEARSTDWYDDDSLLHDLLDRYATDADRARLTSFGPRAAGELRALAETSARPENAPRLRHHDPYDHRIDVVVLPASTREGLRIAHGDEGLGSVRGDPFVHYVMIYLLAQNGEAGVACSVACTDGLVRALDALDARDRDGDPAGAGATGAADEVVGPVHHAALDAVRGSSPDGYAHAAQFVTEIQGGSDVPANRVRAVPEREDPGATGEDTGAVTAGAPARPAFRIHGQKWFCSNINADWFLVTARVGSDGDGDADRDGGRGTIGLFLVPAFVGGHRNAYTIDRLKDKLGTRELATAEVTFDGARAWPVGPPERGLGHLLRYVLTPSRFACVLFAAGALRRAERIAGDYAEFREAFGQPIARYPLVRRTLDTMADARREALVVAFELLRLWQSAEASGYREREAVDFRVLLSLAKPVLTRRATDQLHEAMMVLAGNGIEERFSPLPRLYRDSVIMETWEGPHNVLFTQAVRDLRRFDVDPAAFLERVTGGPRPELAGRLAAVLGIDDYGDAALAMADLAPAVVGAVAEGRG